MSRISKSRGPTAPAISRAGWGGTATRSACRPCRSCCPRRPGATSCSATRSGALSRWIRSRANCSGKWIPRSKRALGIYSTSAVAWPSGTIPRPLREASVNTRSSRSRATGASSRWMHGTANPVPTSATTANWTLRQRSPRSRGHTTSMRSAPIFHRPSSAVQSSSAASSAPSSGMRMRRAARFMHSMHARAHSNGTGIRFREIPATPKRRTGRPSHSRPRVAVTSGPI